MNQASTAGAAALPLSTSGRRSNRKNAAAYLLFALLAVVIVGLHTVHFQGRPFRQDEAWIVQGALYRDGAQDITRWVSVNIHPPLWVMAANAWVDVLGHSETIVRTLSGLITLLALALLFRLGADLAGSPRSPIPFIALALLSTSTYYQFYTHEFRPYPALAACALALALTFLRWLRRPNFRRALLFVASGVTALYVHFFAVYVLGALAIFFLLFVRWRWRWPLALRALGLFVAIGLSYLGWLLPFLNAVLVATPGGIDYALGTGATVLTRIYRGVSLRPLDVSSFLAVTSLLVPVGLALGSRTPAPPDNDRLFRVDPEWRKMLPLIVIVGVVLLSFVVNTVVSNLTLRSLVLLVPFGALFLAFGVAALPRVAWFGLALLLLPSTFPFVDQEYPGPQNEVAAFIAPGYQPGSPIIMNITYVPRHVAVLYYVQERMGATIPKELIWQVILPNQAYTDFMPYEPVNLMHDAGPASLDALGRFLDEVDREQVWLINRNSENSGGSRITEGILSVLARRYEPVNHREWEDEYAVIEFRRRE